MSDVLAPPGPDNLNGTQEFPGMPTLPDNATTNDPEAPYGRKEDGTPRLRPERQYDRDRKAKSKASSPTRKRSGGRAAKAAAGAAKAAAAKTPRARPGAKSASHYGKLATDALNGFVVTPLIGVALATDSTPLLADAAVLDANAAPLGAAIGELAADQPALAAVLDKAGQVSPFVALAAAASQLVAQLAVNHGKLPAGIMGTQRPDLLADSLRVKLGDALAQTEAASGSTSSQTEAPSGFPPEWNGDMPTDPLGTPPGPPFGMPHGPAVPSPAAW